MLSVFGSLLLSSTSASWVTWLVVLLWWILLLKLIVPAVALLVGLVWGTIRYRILWAFIWVPYYMIGNGIYEISKHANWNSEALLSLSDEPGLLVQYAPLFLTMPFLICSHIWLYKRFTRKPNSSAHRFEKDGTS